MTLQQKVTDFVEESYREFGAGPLPEDIEAKFKIDFDTANEMLSIAESYLSEKSLSRKNQSTGEELTPTPEQQEQEIIDLAKEWAAEDADSDSPMDQDAMVDALKDGHLAIKRDRIAELVQIYAPNAPKKEPKPTVVIPPDVPSYPPELIPLIESGVAFHQNDHWFVKNCTKCGEFKTECCGPIRNESAVWHGEKTLTTNGRRAVGLEPIKRPKSQEQLDKEAKERVKDAEWMRHFRGVGELEGNGTVKMYIEEFLPEGIMLLCGLMKEGKSFVAMSIAKALTTGTPLFGNPRFSVPEAVPVLYLAAEGKDAGLKLRCRKFGITEDKSRFIARTLSQGPMFGLDDPNIEALVRTLQPVIIMETLIRFNEAENENDAAENQKLAHALFHLIALGACAVIPIHHSVKRYDKSNPTKQDAARGSGDILAMADVIWLVMQDERLYQAGKGPNEIDMVGWGRDFSPYPMRLALTKKAPKDLPAGEITYAPGIISCIDTTGNFEWVDKKAVQEAKEAADKDLADILEAMVKADPSLTLKKIAQATDTTVWVAASTLRERGWSKPSGKPKKGETNLWQKTA